MRLLHWCMLGVTALLLICEVAVGHLCKSLITMVDGFHTLFVLMHMALPLPEAAAVGKPLLSSLDSDTSPPQPPLSSSSSSSSVAGPPPTQPAESPIKSPLGSQTQAASPQRPTAPPAADLPVMVNLNQLSSVNISPAASTCGLSFPRSRIQAVGIFLSTLLLTSLCTSYLLEIVGFFLNPHPLQHPLLPVVVGAVSLLHKTLVFGLNWPRLQREQGEGGEQPADGTDLQVSHEAEGEFVKRQERAHAAQSSADDSLRSVVLCNPETSSIPECDPQTQQQEPEVRLQEHRVERNDTRSASKSLPRKHPVCRLSSVCVLQGLFTSPLALINSLVMLLIAPQFPHGSEACNPLVYLDPALSLLAVITLIASSLPQLHKFGLLLLQATPPHICVSDVGRRIESVPGVQAVHDLHVWQLNESTAVASVHVHCYAGFPAHRCADVMSGVTKVLQSVGVSCCTIQPEFASAAASSASRSADSSPVIHREDPSPPPHLTCSLTCRKDCSGSMCCSPLEEESRSPTAPPAGETKDEPQTLVIENTFL